MSKILIPIHKDDFAKLENFFDELPHCRLTNEKLMEEGLQNYVIPIDKNNHQIILVLGG